MRREQRKGHDDRGLNLPVSTGRVAQLFNRGKPLKSFLSTGNLAADGVILVVGVYIASWVPAILVLILSKQQSMRMIAKGTMWWLGIIGVLGFCGYVALLQALSSL
jgi:hypothetical protein